MLVPELMLINPADKIRSYANIKRRSRPVRHDVNIAASVHTFRYGWIRLCFPNLKPRNIHKRLVVCGTLFDIGADFDRD